MTETYQAVFVFVQCPISFTLKEPVLTHLPNKGSQVSISSTF